jgi:hypothetical protein
MYTGSGQFLKLVLYYCIVNNFSISSPALFPMVHATMDVPVPGTGIPTMKQSECKQLLSK